MVIAAILLAAGDTSIDGVPLALLPWSDTTTLIEHQIAELQSAGVDVIEVVLGFEAERIIPLVSGNDVEPIVDPRWQTGEASWLRVGASAVPRNTEAAIITHVSEPRTAAVFARLLDEHARGHASITRPSFDGASGRPLVIDSATLAAVRNVSDGGGLEAIITANERSLAHIPMENTVTLRIKTAEDYARARQLLA
jgi:CTP:molybdopterin cytidylyltransferase MocA